MSSPEPKFFTRQEVAERIRKSEQTVDRLVAEGKLRSVRPPGTTWRLIPEEALDEFLYGEQGLASVHDLSERRAK